MHVAVITDKAFVPWTATTILSCVEACAGPLHVHLLYAPDVTAADQRLLADMAAAHGAALVLHPVDDLALAAMAAKGPPRGPRISWARVLLPDLLPDLDRVIYLDADTLVVAPIDPLWELSLDGAPLAAATNVTEKAMRPHLASLGIDDPAAFFNAGVLVVDLQRWREERASQKIVDFVLGRTELLPWYDQDALNAVFAGRRRLLHPRWNAMNSLWIWRDLAVEILGEDQVREATADPAILHFEGPSLAKPWHYLCDHPWRDRYRATLRRTPFADTPLQGRNLATRAIARLPRQQRLPAYVALQRTRSKLTAMRDRVAPRRVVPAGESRGFAMSDTMSDGDRSIVERSERYSMTSRERLLAVIDAVTYLTRRNVPGAFAECGVWRGGSVLAMILTLQRLGVDDRDIFLFDTFEGMTAPTPVDVSSVDDPALETWTRAEAEGHRPFSWLFGAHMYGLDQVRALFEGTGYPPDRLHYVRGPVEDTLPAHAPAELALLRLDTDWYESTHHELVHLYPRLSTGGVLIVDDYGHWEGARKAVDEYFAGSASPVLLTRVDYTGRVAVKL